MRFLVHGSLSPTVAEALVRNGHSTESVEATTHAELFKTARAKQLDVVTNDAALANAPFGESALRFDRSLVYLLESDDENAAIDRLFERYKRLAPGRLYTVTQSRVKVRQLPGSK